MNYRKDIDIVIQGPLNKTSLQNIGRYKEFGTVIISHWAKDDLTLLDEFIDDIDVKIVTIPDVYAASSLVPDYRLHQWQTTHEGLKASTKKYCVKVRSDEYYTDLSALIERFILDDDKMVTGNVFWKGLQPGVSNFHICDHIMICKRDHFCNSLTILFQDIAKGRLPMVWSPPGTERENHIPSESVFGSYYLCSKLGVTFEQLEKKKKRELKELLTKYFDYLDVNLFGDYKICWNSPPDGGQNIVFRPGVDCYKGQTRNKEE